MPMSELSLLDLYLTTLDADLFAQQHKLEQIQAVAEVLTAPHDDNEALAFTLLRRLLDQAHTTVGVQRAGLADARQAVKRIQDKLGAREGPGKEEKG